MSPAMAYQASPIAMPYGFFSTAGYGQQTMMATPITSPTATTTTTISTPPQHPTGRSTTPTNQIQGSNKIYVLGEFKRGRTVQFESSFLPQPGDFLICEGDNGEDLGMCTHSWVGSASSAPVVNNSLAANRNSSGSDVDPISGDPIYPKIIRQATPREVQTLHGAQAQAESKCVEMAKHKVMEHRLSMKVVDAEYQFDKKKLTFYYDADERIDFRELVRDLYKIYRARIWMSKVRNEEEPIERKTKSSHRHS
jgi:hypothetical protein